MVGVPDRGDAFEQEWKLAGTLLLDEVKELVSHSPTISLMELVICFSHKHSASQGLLNRFSEKLLMWMRENRATLFGVAHAREEYVYVSIDLQEYEVPSTVFLSRIPEIRN